MVTASVGTWQPPAGTRWNPSEFDPSLPLIHAHEETALQVFYECSPCLGRSRRFTPQYHVICRVAVALRRYRGEWIHLKVLTSITYDITGMEHYEVQRAVSELRRKHGWKILGKKTAFGGGNTHYMLEAE